MDEGFIKFVHCDRNGYHSRSCIYANFGSWCWKVTLNVCLCALNPDSSTAAIEYLKNSRMIPVYIYFDLANIEMQTANKVAASLLKQLASPPDQDRPVLRTIYEYIKEDNRPSRQALIDLFLRCSKSVNVRVLFDALDECSPKELENIYQLIEKLCKADIGVLLTTRPHITDYLRTRFPDASYMEDIQADAEDVHNVLKHRIEEHTPPIEHDLKEDILNRILNSRGTYLLFAARGL